MRIIGCFGFLLIALGTAPVAAQLGCERDGAILPISSEPFADAHGLVLVFQEIGAQQKLLIDQHVESRIATRERLLHNLALAQRELREFKTRWEVVSERSRYILQLETITLPRIEREIEEWRDARNDFPKYPELFAVAQVLVSASVGARAFYYAWHPIFTRMPLLSQALVAAQRVEAFLHPLYSDSLEGRLYDYILQLRAGKPTFLTQDAAQINDIERAHFGSVFAIAAPPADR